MKKSLVFLVAFFMSATQLAAAAGLSSEDRRKFSDMGVYILEENITLVVLPNGVGKRLACVNMTKSKSVLLLDITANLFGPHEIIFVRCHKGKFEVGAPQVKGASRT